MARLGFDTNPSRNPSFAWFPLVAGLKLAGRNTRRPSRDRRLTGASRPPASAPSSSLALGRFGVAVWGCWPRRRDGGQRRPPSFRWCGSRGQGVEKPPLSRFLSLSLSLCVGAGSGGHEARRQPRPAVGRPVPPLLLRLGHRGRAPKPPPRSPSPFFFLFFFCFCREGASAPFYFYFFIFLIFFLFLFLLDNYCVTSIINTSLSTGHVNN